MLGQEMKQVIIGVTIALITGCMTHKYVSKYKYLEGEIILDKTGHGVFIPKTTMNRDIVFLSYHSLGDSIRVFSEFKKSYIPSTYYFSGNNNLKDSIYLKFKSNRPNFQMGFLMVEFYGDQKETIRSYSLIENKKTISYTDSIKYFQLEYLGAKSQFFKISEKKDTLNININFLTEEELSRYTEIDTVIAR